jgi:hypothetical protein
MASGKFKFEEEFVGAEGTETSIRFVFRRGARGHQAGIKVFKTRIPRG